MSELPTRLGKYDIVRALGSGAMGVVYEAVDSVIERTVAIKTIRKSDLDPDEAAEHSRRFLIEAKAAGKLNHPNIISLYDHGDEAGMAYIVMELVRGRELQHYFDDKYAFTPTDVVRLMGELLDALGYSHQRGVVHRDVKPANIFITEAGSIKLGDFGIARIETNQKTRVGALMGTPSYMSPEQIRGEPADARSDLYAAGVVLYQFLTGERPYGGSMLAMAMKVLNDPVPRASAANPAVTPALDAVVQRALAKRASERFQSATEFWQALAAAVGLALAPEPPPRLAGQGGSTLGAGERGRSLFGATTGWGQVPTPTHPGTLDASATELQPVATEAGQSGRSDRQAPAVEAPSPVPSPVAPPLPPPLLPPLPPPAPMSAVRPASTPSLASAAGSSAAEAPGQSPRRALLVVAGLALAVIAAGWWWTQRHPVQPQASGEGEVPARAELPAPSARTPTPMPLPTPPAAPGADPALGRPQAPEPIPAPAPAPAPAPVPMPVPVPAPLPVPAKAPPPAPAPRPPRDPKPMPAAEAAPRPAPAAVPVAKAVRPARCSDILQKASLEALTAEEGAYLRKECQ